MTLKKLLMLVAHEPGLDPRVSWSAQTASKLYDVEIWGLLQPELTRKYVDPEGIAVHREDFQSAQISNLPFFRILLLCARMHPFQTAWYLFVTTTFSVLILFCALLIKIGLYVYPKVKKWAIASGLGFLHRLKPYVKNLAPFRWTKLALKDVRTLVSLFRHFLKTAAAFHKLWSQTEAPAKIIQCNDLDTLLAGVILKDIYGTKLIYDAHEFYPYQFIERRGFFYFILSKYEEILIKQADEILTVSPQLAEIMQKHYGLPKPIRLLPNCSPLEKIEIQPSTSNKIISFLYQGNFAEGRGIESLIQFWSRAEPQNAELILRGSSGEFKDRCRELAKASGAKNIHFAEPVKESELIFAAAQADIGIIPYEPISINNKYCCPNKLSQYMQAGLFILHNRLPYVREIVSNNSCGAEYGSDNYQDFKSTIDRIISDSNWRTEHKKNSRKGALENYNWEIVSAELLEAYQS